MALTTIQIELPDFSDEETLADAVERRIVDRIYNDISKDAKEAVRKMVVEKVAVRADRILLDTLDTGVQLTNMYGEAKGDSQTLRELITATAAKRFDEKVDAKTGGRTTYNQPTCSRTEWMVNNAVSQAIAKQLAAVEAEVRKQAYEAMLVWLQAHGIATPTPAPADSPRSSPATPPATGV